MDCGYELAAGYRLVRLAALELLGCPSLTSVEQRKGGIALEAEIGAGRRSNSREIFESR